MVDAPYAKYLISAFLRVLLGAAMGPAAAVADELGACGMKLIKGNVYYIVPLKFTPD